jgi:hypothetical protein
MPAEPSGTLQETPARRHATLVLIALAYLSVWPYFERLNNPNENVRVWMTRAIVEHHTMAIDRVLAEWGYVNDKAFGGGHIYSGKAPGASFVGVPVLWAQTKLWHARGWPSPTKRAAVVALRLFTVMIPSIVFLWFFGRWVWRRTGSATARDLMIVALGAGTMLYPYGILFVGHAQAALAGFTSYMLMSRLPAGGISGHDPRPGPGRMAAAGGFAGAAVILEYQLLLIAALLAGYAIWNARKGALWFFGAALPFAVALGAYHTALFGRPWDFPYGHLENQGYAQLVSVGYHGLRGPRMAALATSLFSVSYGLFAFSPFLALGLILGLIAAVRGPRPDGLIVVTATLLMTIFISGLAHWRAGWCVGPRYIAGAVPFLTLGLVIGWPAFSDGSRRAEALRALVGGLIGASVFANGLSAAVYPHYPEQFDNPIYDLALPLVRDGYVPYGLGWALGLPRLWSLSPVAVFLAVAILLAVGGHARARRQAVARIVAAIAVAVCFLIAISRYGRGPSALETSSASTVRALWDPRPLPRPLPRLPPAAH